MLLTGNVFVLIFLSRLGGELAWAELVGAAMAAGAVVLVLGPLGLTQRLAAWLPPPIVFGLLTGAVLPFFTGLFSELTEARLLVGGTLLAYVLGRRFLEPRPPAILPALVAGVALAWGSGELAAPTQLAWTLPSLTMPELSVRAIVTATPVMVVLITLQANIPSLVFLRSQGYDPPDRTLSLVSGVGTIGGSLLGPLGVSLSLPATALSAGPEAGDRLLRHRSVYVAAGGAVVGVLSTALERVAEGPLLLGPLFAFGIALSELSMFGVGSFFWALVTGVAVSALLERDGWAALRRSSASTR